jgi:hypothetical protein
MPPGRIDCGAYGALLVGPGCGMANGAGRGRRFAGAVGVVGLACWAGSKAPPTTQAASVGITKRGNIREWWGDPVDRARSHEQTDVPYATWDCSRVGWFARRRGGRGAGKGLGTEASSDRPQINPVRLRGILLEP